MKNLGNFKKLKSLAQNQKAVILIVAGKKSYFKSGSDLFFKNLFKKNILHYYFKSSSYPEIKEVKKIAKKICMIKPSVIFAIGGGSVIDLAKIANIIDLKKKLQSKYIIRTKKKISKLIAIPLTAGSGAEATSTAVLYISKKKVSIENDQVKPDYFFLIPELVKNAPNKIKGPAVFDCIAQAVESIFSLKSNPKSIFYALKSLKISLKYYLSYYKKPNLLNSKKMLFASHHAGQAIDISRTIASHAISYPFTSLFGFSHGKAVAISFVGILKFNFLNRSGSILKKVDIENRYKLLFDLTRTKNIIELANYFQNLIANLDIETNKINSKINLKEKWPVISRGINEKRLLNNPVLLNKKNIKQILLSSF